MIFRKAGITNKSFENIHPVDSILTLLDNIEISISKAEKMSGISTGTLARLIRTPERFSSDREFVMDIATRLGVGLRLYPEEALALLSAGMGYKIRMGSIRDRCRLFFINHIDTLRPADCDSLLGEMGMGALQGHSKSYSCPELTDKAAALIDDFSLTISLAQKDKKTIAGVKASNREIIDYFMDRDNVSVAELSNRTNIPEYVIEKIIFREYDDDMENILKVIMPALKLNDCERTACLQYYGFDTGVYIT